MVRGKRYDLEDSLMEMLEVTGDLETTLQLETLCLSPAQKKDNNNSESQEQVSSKDHNISTCCSKGLNAGQFVM